MMNNKCKGIVNLYYKSKLDCNKNTNNPITFIKNSIHKQETNILYLYIFDNGTYISKHNSENTIIKKINDPTKLAILWNTYGEKLKIKDRIKHIVNEINKINKIYFNNKYKVNEKFIKKSVINNNNLLDILLVSIISITTKPKSVCKSIMTDLIGIIHSILGCDKVGINIGMHSIQPFIDNILVDINKTLLIKNFETL